MLISIICLLMAVVHTCDITVEVIAQSDSPMFAQFTFHNGTKSKLYHFKRKDQKKKLRIKDGVCNLKPTVLTTYRERPGPGSEPIGQTSAFIEGIGATNYLVYYDSNPRMGMRLGVVCGFGDCGAQSVFG